MDESQTAFVIKVWNNERINEMIHHEMYQGKKE